jgi:hypothetical protein
VIVLDFWLLQQWDFHSISVFDYLMRIIELVKANFLLFTFQSLLMLQLLLLLETFDEDLYMVG